MLLGCLHPTPSPPHGEGHAAIRLTIDRVTSVRRASTDVGVTPTLPSPKGEAVPWELATAAARRLLRRTLPRKGHASNLGTEFLSSPRFEICFGVSHSPTWRAAERLAIRRHKPSGDYNGIASWDTTCLTARADRRLWGCSGATQSLSLPAGLSPMATLSPDALPRRDAVPFAFPRALAADCAVRP